MSKNKYGQRGTQTPANLEAHFTSFITLARACLLTFTLILGLYVSVPSFRDTEYDVMAPWNFWQSTALFTSTASLLAEGTRVKVTDLSASSWTVSNEKLNISVPGKLPSVVHLDLFAAGVITDPYYGLNDFNLRWVGENNWTYSTVVQGLLQKPNTTWLLFNGLDTFTSIQFCGKHVASTNNQFRQYAFDVSVILRDCKGDPKLNIEFGSAPLIGKKIAELPGQETWPRGVEGLFEYEHRQFVRKEQSDFGWDWGPAFVPAGPWLPAFVIQNNFNSIGENNVYIRNTLVDIYRLGQLPLIPPDQTQPWMLNMSLDVLGSLKEGDSIRARLASPDKLRIWELKVENVTIQDSTITGSASVNPKNVILWWPSGLGRQNLFSLNISVVRGGGSIVLASTTKRVGFRTIVLNQEPITQHQLDRGVANGSNWKFEINGNEFYAKGSNFIPPDAFWPRVTEERIRSLFSAVVAGNQNMLRVWASGAYLPDFVYDIADELGILLWSEFQFGDALYPVDKAFLDNVREEANYQVRRVNHHPSLALWAGGNELENLELRLVLTSAPQLYGKYVGEYEQLFLDTLVPCVFENSRSISYTPSSTSNGWLSLNFSLPQPITQRYDRKDADGIYGDTDYYAYDSYDAFNSSLYPIGRFSNEFGYHSMPSPQTWAQVLDPKDLWFNSTTIRLRNHHYPMGGLNTTNTEKSDEGMAEMTIAVQRWYPTPNKVDPAANFSAWIHGTQIFQADFYKSQIQFYRRGSGMPERQLGSLYWQLEDIWQAPTWAGIEYDGRWKVLHYVAKDIYQNVIISPFYDKLTSILQIYVTSDLWDGLIGSARFQWYDWSGKPLNVTMPHNYNLTVGALNTTKVSEVCILDLLSTYDSRNAVLYMETTMIGHVPNADNPIPDQPFLHKNWFHPAPLSEAKLVDPGLTLTFDDAKQHFIVNATKGVAAWVWLDYPAGPVVQFEDNGFWLRKGEWKTVGYTVISGDKDWIKGVTVQSLWDMSTP